MKIIEPINIILYATSTGKQPFNEWRKTLTTAVGVVVASRLARVRSGNFGDCKQLSGADGVCELCIDYGPGFRIYYGKKGATVVVLLVGGDKGSQNRDIAKAKRYWLDFKERI